MLKVGPGQVFLPALLFPPVSIIPTTFHTHLHIHVALTRRTNGRRLGTFLKAIPVRYLTSTAYKTGFTVAPLLFTTSKCSTIGNVSSQSFTGAISGVYCIQIRLIFLFKGFSTVSTPQTFCCPKME